MSRRRTAVFAGALYLVTHVSSIGAAVAYRIEPTTTGALRAGAMLEVVLALACLGTGVLLLTILRPYGSAGAHAFSALRTLEAAVIMAGILPMLTLADAAATGLPEAGLTRMHEASFLLGQGLVIAVNTLVLATLLWRSRLVFPGIAVLGFVGGALVLVSDLAQLFGVIEHSGALAAALAAPIFAFELWFAGYLLFVGFRPDSPERMEQPPQTDHVPLFTAPGTPSR